MDTRKVLLYMCLHLRSCLHAAMEEFPFQRHIPVFSISIPRHMTICYTVPRPSTGS